MSTKRKPSPETAAGASTPAVASQKRTKASNDAQPETPAEAPPPAAASQKRAKDGGNKRPAPPEAKLGYVKKEDRPNFAPMQANHVTNMRFSVQPFDNGLGFVHLTGVGPVKEPMLGTSMNQAFKEEMGFNYTGFVEPHNCRSANETSTENVAVRDWSARSQAWNVFRSPAVPHGEGEIVCKDWWAKGEFKHGVANGNCSFGCNTTGLQYAAEFVDGKLYGEVDTYDMDGSLKSSLTFKDGTRDGYANEYIGPERMHGVGYYNSGKMHGAWKMTAADGMHYTAHYNMGVELIEKRTAPIYLPPLPPPPEKDADGNPKIYTVEEAVKLANDDLLKRSFGPLAKEKQRKTPHERRLMNALSRQVQAAGWRVVMEHPAGESTDQLDMMHTADEDFLVLNEGKVNPSGLPETMGHLITKHTWLLDNDEEVKKADEEDRLILCDIVAAKPKDNGVKAAAKVGQQVWWPDKGDYPAFIKATIKTRLEAKKSDAKGDESDWTE